MIARTAKVSKALTTPNLIGVNASGFGFIAPPPARDPLTRALVFEDAPTFRPNMTPSEVLHAGAWGGGYFRDIYSSIIKQRCEQAWRELPADWIKGLNVDKQLASRKYNSSINKFKGSAPILPYPPQPALTSLPSHHRPSPPHSPSKLWLQVKRR